jgi:hypothetical protein
MPKRISLEDKFIKVLEKRGISYHGSIFNLGSILYLPDFVFNDLIVEVDGQINDKRLKTIKEFKKHSPGYKIVLLVDDGERMLDLANIFDEILDFASIDVLISEIKRNLK